MIGSQGSIPTKRIRCDVNCLALPEVMKMNKEEAVKLIVEKMECDELYEDYLLQEGDKNE